MKLELNIFKFDCKSDYLPYYTKHFVKIEKQETLLDILNQINNEQNFSYENNKDFCIVINGLFTKLSITILQLVEKFGKDLTIEPISIRRAYKDLLIDDNDFKEKFKLLKKFTNKEDEKNYLNNKIYFYASNTMNFYHNYLGDPIFYLAHELIERNPDNKEEILNIIKNEEYSIEYHTSLKNRIYNFDNTKEEKIIQIKNELGLLYEVEAQEFCIDKKITIDFDKVEEEEIKHNFKDFNLAYYYGEEKDSQTQKLLENLKAKKIDIKTKDIDLNLSTFIKNPELSLKLASSILLEAYDSAADLLIVDNKQVFKLLETNRKTIAKLCGREVIIPILHKNELALLAYSKFDKAKELLKKHEVNPEII
ncbi:hypothetical protein CP965_10635 [Halarcobacter mediterraneus]|uniref:DUF5644 domain-containing protein n=1 Tax=Halarcobacter mediterraneus TaxID=2023153 RepID=A0A4Q1ARR3_9BACT|nr:2Fe-2S iron-sulfur cluster-binding protein [Halarcobacter mediterraneus]RXK12225.1 hypothetical protein CP965_10635 [Halarcobacter mediterraneus]